MIIDRYKTGKIFYLRNINLSTSKNNLNELVGSIYNDLILVILIWLTISFPNIKIKCPEKNVYFIAVNIMVIVKQLLE